MKRNNQLGEYLEKIVGAPVNLRQLPASRLSGLPVFLTSDYVFSEWRWLDQTLVLAQAKQGNEEPSATNFKSVQQLLVAHFKSPVVFVYPALEIYRRNRFVQLKLPFIVPGCNSSFLPFASLCEQFQRLTKPAKLSAAAQATVLFQIMQPPPVGSLLSQWAAWLGYSAMTMTKVRDELVADNLCVREDGAKPRGLRFLNQGHALWVSALPFLRSPVRLTCWAIFKDTPKSLPVAGLTALSKCSMLEDDPIPTYACHEKAWKELLADKSVRKLDHQDEATARVECWRYEPGLLAENAIVDRLSLFLSMADSSDERIRLAAASLLEGMQW